MGRTGNRLQDDVVHFAHHRIGALEARTRRQEDDDGLVANVLFGDEAGRHSRHLEAGEADQADIEHGHDGGRPDETAGHLAVARRQPFETGVEAAEESPCQIRLMPRGLRGLVVRLQQHRAERRAQGQGDDDRDDRRGGDGRRELSEEQARDAADEGGRNEHGAQRQRDGDERG